MVMGHNIQDERVRVRCNGLVHLIDIAMSSAIYGAHVVAWECVGCLRRSTGALDSTSDRGVSIRALYDDTTVPLPTGIAMRLRDDLRGQLRRW
jgi:hypothetical protein